MSGDSKWYASATNRAPTAPHMSTAIKKCFVCTYSPCWYCSDRSKHFYNPNTGKQYYCAKRSYQSEVWWVQIDFINQISCYGIVVHLPTDNWIGTTPEPCEPNGKLPRWRSCLLWAGERNETKKKHEFSRAFWSKHCTICWNETQLTSSIHILLAFSATPLFSRIPRTNELKASRLVSVCIIILDECWHVKKSALTSSVCPKENMRMRKNE